MVSVLASKGASLYKRHILSRTSNLCFKSLTTIPNKDVEAAASSPSEYSTSLHLSSFFSDFNHPSTGFDIELVDHDAWGVSSGVAQAWREPASRAITSLGPQVTDETLDDRVEGQLDFEYIDSMRVWQSILQA